MKNLEKNNKNPNQHLKLQEVNNWTIKKISQNSPNFLEFDYFECPSTMATVF